MDFYSLVDWSGNQLASPTQRFENDVSEKGRIFIELYTYSLLAILIGMRHGMDGDHVAAIADMVGSEKKKRKQLSLGMMYALGHGTIVLTIGFISIYLGLEMSEQTRQKMELLVGVTLVILGGYMMYSLFQQKEGYEYKSRLQIIFLFLAKCAEKTNLKGIEKRLTPLHLGIISAFIIGVIHGIGVESPTQITILTNVTGDHTFAAATVQLILFVVGLLISTVLIAFLLTWGFMKARLRKSLFLLLGLVTGIYSLVLGITMLVEILKGGI
ncbi:High-affinity nickel-transporter [Neobacillus sp. LXY-4]|uniref:HoxN/HupN/NixA family nickel/cobalt transporter n=1 Tax=Neobacillus sp. LXY-4 TaxID=3379826 RepID=UPI003EE0F0E3